MNKELILLAFAKAEQELKNRGVTAPSLTQMATVLSDYLEEHHDLQLGEKRLRMYRGAAEKTAGKSEDISIKRLAVINGLCDYLGYNSYQDFVEGEMGKGEMVEKSTEVITPINRKKKGPSLFLKMVILATVLGFASLIIYNYANRQRWMVWQENQYVEVDFDAKKYELKQLKIYKEDRITAFKKVALNCNTVFFNNDGSVRFWYGKNKNKELEYFTDLGLHPETGKTLKPITKYMIEKHVCGE